MRTPLAPKENEDGIGCGFFKEREPMVRTSSKIADFPWFEALVPGEALRTWRPVPFATLG